MAAEHHNPITRAPEGRQLRVAAAFALLGLATAAFPLVPWAWAAGLYDGTYHGQLTADGNNATTCAKAAPIQIVVTNDQLEYHHFNSAVIHTAVAPDGKFSATAPSSYSSGRNTPMILTLTGQISGGAIAAKASVSSFCSYALSLKKFL
jgi:hypothetical protein